MQEIGGRLGPVRADAPPALTELALATRAHFARLDISVRTYAAQQARSASSITRYLNATNVPPEDFVSDLIHEVANLHGEEFRDEAIELRRLHRVAQDALPGGWGQTKRLKAERAKLRQQLRAADLDRQAAVAAQRATLEALRKAQKSGGLDPEQSFLRLELERTQSELSASRTLLANAEHRIAQLEHDITQLRGLDPVPTARGTSDWHPWYRPEARQHPHWRHYSNVLETKGWTAPALASLDAATNEVVGRLANPSAPSAYQARGMVSAYVQSGAAAHIAGLLAKAIDAGYRLVIVISGATNAVRQQLQERLDDELPSLPDTSGIVRLTTPAMDYRQLADRLSILRFEKRTANQPLNSPENLSTASVRLMVVKGNAAVLRRLVNDLAAIGTPLNEVPALIVDAGGINDPNSSINASIARLLSILPRAQYVSYVTTPFTQALINADVSSHTFPSDFIVSLPRPDDYIGAQELLADDEAGSMIRDVGPGDDGLLQALDMFVLTGAIKVYRESMTRTRFPHHLLLVPGTARRGAQESLHSRVSDLWRIEEYSEVSGRRRLSRLFQSEFVQPLDGTDHLPLPASFSDLAASLDTVLTRLGANPMEPADPATGWRMVVVPARSQDLLLTEAPTITYLSDDPGTTGSLAALQQSFGLRFGYSDLVRFYYSSHGTPSRKDLLDFALQMLHRGEVASGINSVPGSAAHRL